MQPDLFPEIPRQVTRDEAAILFAELLTAVNAMIFETDRALAIARRCRRGNITINGKDVVLLLSYEYHRM